jgi:hypothetical protein
MQISYFILGNCVEREEFNAALAREYMGIDCIVSLKNENYHKSKDYQETPEGLILHKQYNNRVINKEGEEFAIIYSSSASLHNANIVCNALWLFPMKEALVNTFYSDASVDITILDSCVLEKRWGRTKRTDLRS